MVTTITEQGTWGGVFGRRSKRVKKIAADLRSLIVGLHPDTVEIPRKGDKVVSFGFGEKKLNDTYCYLKPQSDRVNVGFQWGVNLDDVNGLMDGDGKRMRHLIIADQETARSAKVAHLIHLAIQERSSALRQTRKSA